jgi:hypothetical protein
MKFFGMAYKNQNATKALETDFEKLEDFQPDPKSKGFSEFIGGLISDCEVFEAEAEEDDEYNEK